MTISSLRAARGERLVLGSTLAVAAAAWILLAAAPHVPALASLHHPHATAAAALDPLVFLPAWLVMVAAMMLPTAVPMVQMFTAVTAGVARSARLRAAFLLAYFAVWLGFAGVALLGDTGVHELVERSSWLRDRDGLVLVGTLALAGIAQFTPLTRRCLRACRDPRGFLYRHYQRGLAAAWALGVRHGLSCLGCCWALMLVMFATGVGNLWWMVALTAVMVAEKTTRWGPRLVSPVGVVLLVAAAWLGVAALGSAPAVELPAPDHHHGG
jgi:predicted metal-binding membrane protein